MANRINELLILNNTLFQIMEIYQIYEEWKQKIKAQSFSFYL